MNIYRHERLSIRDGDDGDATVRVRKTEASSIEANEQLVSREHRSEAAQALAGDEHVVVPAKQDPDHWRREAERLKRENDELQAFLTEPKAVQPDRSEARSSDRPEPVDPSEVKVGDVVEIDFEKWGIWGEVTAKGTFHDGIGIRRYGTDEDDWINCADGTVHVLHPAEPEPDPAAVEALREVYFAAEYAVLEPEGDIEASKFIRELAKRGVRVVSTDE